MKKRGITLLLALAVMTLTVVLLMPAAFAETASVSYIDANGNTATVEATVLTGSETSLAEGWYVVNSNITFTQQITLSGSINLILADGYTANFGTSESRFQGFGIYSLYKHDLTIYGGSKGTGALKFYTRTIAILVRNYNQYGGNVTCNSNSISNCIDVNNINIRGGTLDVTCVSGISCRYGGTIIGGRVTVTDQYGGINLLSGTITLGCTGGDDFIMVNNYSTSYGTFKIAEGQVLKNAEDDSQTFGGNNINPSAINGKKLVYARSVLAYAINISPNIANGSVTASSEYANEYSDVTLTAAPDSGYAVKSLAVTYTDANNQTQTVPVRQGSGDNANKYTFTMPSAVVSVAATFEPVAVLDDIPANMALVSGSGLKLDSASGTASEAEAPAKLFDGNTNTKWSAANNSGSFRVEFHSTEPIVVRGYRLTTASDSDYYGRVPTSWTLKAKANKEDQNWTVLDTWSNTTAMIPWASKKDYSFTVPTDETSYQYFCLEVSNVNCRDNKPMLQLSELALLEKKIAKVTTTPTAKTDLTYTGSEQDLVTAGTAENGAMRYVLGNDANTAPADGWAAAIPTGSNAGDYYVWYKAAGNTDCADSAPVCLMVTIAKGTSTIITSPAAIPGLVCTGGYQQLITPGVVNVGTLEYAITENNTAPTAENLWSPQHTGWSAGVGTCYAWYRVKGNDNFTGIEPACITVTVGKGTAKVTRIPKAKTELTYDGSAQELLSDAGVAYYGTMQYALGTDGTTAPTAGWSAVKPTGTAAGKYYVWYKAAGNQNYDDSEPAYIEAAIGMGKAQVTTAPTAATELVYDGTQLTLLSNGGATNDGTMQYMLGSDTETAPATGWSTEIPKGTNAGNYYVWYRVLADSTHFNSDAAFVEITIGKGSSSVTTQPTAIQNLEYTGSALALVNAGTASGGMLYYALGESGQNAPTEGWSDAIPTGTGVGSYYVWYKVVGDSNHNNIDAAPVGNTIQINPGACPITEPQAINGLYYTGAPQDLIIPGEAKGEGLTMIYTLGEEGRPYFEGWSTDVPQATKPGIYYVWYSTGSNSNYNNNSGHVTVEIKSAAAIQTAPTAIHPTYSGSAQALVNKGTVSYGSMNYALGNNAETAPIEGWSNDIPTATNAGSYYVWYKALGDENYGGSAPECVDASIEKADATVTTAPQGVIGLVYDGNVHSLLTEGQTNDGTLYYAVDTGADFLTYATAIPAGTDAGTYLLWYYVGGDANHNDSRPVFIVVIIDKANASVTQAPTPKTNLEYTGAAQELVTAGTAGSGTMRYAIGESSTTAPTDEDWSVDIPTGTNAGKYFVWYKAGDSNGGDNYIESAAACVEVNIATVQVQLTTLPAAITKLVCDGQPHNLITAGTAESDVTIQYALGSDAEKAPTENWNTAIPVATDAGTYYVWYSAESDNNHYPLQGCITVTISNPKATVITAPTAKTNLVYTGQPLELVNAGVSSTGKMLYAIGNSSVTAPTEGWSEDIPTAVNADFYYVYYKAAGDDNYNESDPQYLGLTIDPAPIHFITEPAAIPNLVYTGQAQNLIAAGTVESGITVMYALGDKDNPDYETYSENVPQGTEPGTYIVWYSASGSGNNYSHIEGTIEATIAPADASVTSAPTAIENLSYTGSAQNLVTAGVASHGTMQYALGENGTTAPTSGWGNDVPSGTNAGTYYVWYKVVGDANYFDVAARCIPVSIAKLAGTSAPAGLVGIAPTEGGNDGQITGVTSDMEYAASADFSAPVTCSGTSVTGLSAGTYYVRAKETASHLAGAAATVTVPARPHTHDGVTFNTWSYTDSLPNTAGAYCLVSDVELTTQWQPQADILLCLDGHTITVQANHDVIGITGHTLDLYDCANTGRITHAAGATGRGVYVNVGGTFNMHGGIISGNTAAGADGGGVHVNTEGTFNLSGGEISGNTAAGAGGGVYLTGSGTFEMSGGEISGNTALYGSGVYFNAGTFNLSGSPLITGSEGSSTVYLDANCKITIIGELQNTTPIGITMAAPGVFTDGTNISYNDPARFRSDNDSYVIGKNNVEQLFVNTSPCTVSYDANNATGGTVPTDPNSPYVSGSCVTVLGNKGNLVRDGYTFDEWSLNADGTGDSYYNGYNFTIQSNTTLYARWKPIAASFPTITAEPQNLSLIYGYTEGSLSVTAAAPTDTAYTLSYQWYSCNSTGFEEQPISGATTGSYSIPAGKAAGTTEYYYCRITATRTDNGQTAYADSAIVQVQVAQKSVTVTAKPQLIADTGYIKQGADQATLAEALAGHTLYGVILTENRSLMNIVPSAAVIRDASDTDVTANYAVKYVPGTLTVRAKTNATFTLPQNARMIDESAFEGLTLMTAVDARYCTSIGANAFKGCTGLTQIQLPQNCSIHSSAFSGCGTVYVYAPSGGTTETYCDQYDNLIFLSEHSPK